MKTFAGIEAAARQSQNPWWINAAKKLDGFQVIGFDMAAEQKPDLAAQLATRVFDRIERDGTLIRQNMETEIREGLALLNGYAIPSDDDAMQKLAKVARVAFNEVMNHQRVKDMPDCFRAAIRDLHKALTEIGA